MTQNSTAGFGDVDLALEVRALAENRAVLSMRGRLDAAAAPAVKARIRDLVGQGRVELVCDLTEVAFLDASGLSALISGLRFARVRGGFLRLAGLDEQVASEFKQTRLDRVFEMYPSTEAALA